MTHTNSGESAKKTYSILCTVTAIFLTKMMYKKKNIIKNKYPERKKLYKSRKKSLITIMSFFESDHTTAFAKPD